MKGVWVGWGCVGGVGRLVALRDSDVRERKHLIWQFNQLNFGLL